MHLVGWRGRIAHFVEGIKKNSGMGFSLTERKAAIGLAGVFATRMLGLFMIMPIFAIYGPSLDGFTPLWMGLAIGIYGLTQALLQIPSGYLSDKIGRKPVIYGGLLIFMFGSIVAALSDHILWVVVGRALQGAGAISSAVLALAADLSSDEQRPKVMAVIGVFIGLSFTIALIVGPLVAGPFGLSGVFWLTAGLALVALLIVKFVVPNALTRAPSGDTTPRTELIWVLLSDKQLWRFNAAVFTIHFCVTALFTVLPQKLLDDSASSQGMWQILLPILLVSFVMLVPMMMMFNRRGQVKQGLIVAAAFMVLSAIVLAGFSNHWMVILAVVLFFSGFNYLEAGLPSMVSLFAPVGQKGSAMGVFTTSQFAGAFVGGIVAGALLQWHSSAAVFWAMAAAVTGWIVYALGMQQRGHLKSLNLSVPHAPEHDDWLDQLLLLPGVSEAVFVADESVVYLKVNKHEYDAQRVESLISAPKGNIEGE